MKQAFICEIPPKAVGDGMFHHRKIVTNLIRMHGTRNDGSHQGMPKWELLERFRTVEDNISHQQPVEEVIN